MLQASEPNNEGEITGPIAFLKTHCLNCHGEKKQKGDRRFDHLSVDLFDEDSAYEWQEILDMVNLGEMPPEDDEQPTDEERTGFVSWITPKIGCLLCESSGEGIHGASSDEQLPVSQHPEGFIGSRYVFLRSDGVFSQRREGGWV